MTAESAKAIPAARAPWPWRIAAWIATFAAVLALGYVIAYWGWRWLGPTPAPLPLAALPERLAPVIAGVPLFGRAEGPATPTPDTPASALQGDTRLLGVFAGADGTGHALFRLRGRGPVLVRSGEEITKDVTLLEVRPDGVRIRDRGETREIALRTNVAAATRISAAATRAAATGSRAERRCAPPAGYTGPVYRINAELLRASRRGRTAGRRCSRRFPAASRCARAAGARRCSA